MYQSGCKQLHLHDNILHANPGWEDWSQLGLIWKSLYYTNDWLHKWLVNRVSESLSKSLFHTFNSEKRVTSLPHLANKWQFQCQITLPQWIHTLKVFQEGSWTSPLLLPLPLCLLRYQIEELQNLLHHYELLHIDDHQQEYPVKHNLSLIYQLLPHSKGGIRYSPIKILQQKGRFQLILKPHKLL